jgi:FAD-dependent urate hydroxylase
MTSTNTVVVGAGPYALSLAAHIAPLGIEHRIFGLPMSSWRDHMPKGMTLKSEPYATDLSAPTPGFTTEDHAREIGVKYRNRVTPLTLEQFLSYGDWFAENLAPQVEQNHIVSVAKSKDGFRLETDTGETLSARRVVVSTGIVPFAYIPPVLKELGSDVATHSSAHSDLGMFRGTDVAVIGAGQSATELAALLHENGARPCLVVRGPGIYWNAANPANPSWKRRLKTPPARLCEGWKCLGYTVLPDLFRTLPEGSRVRQARTFLGPSGSWWLETRVRGVVPTWVGSEIVSASRVGDRVQLDLFGPGPSRIECDHVIAATGFRYDVNQLSYLDDALRHSLKTAGGAPVLSRTFESSVPNLYFTGALSAPSMGPSMRFIAGTHFAAPRIARALAA